MIKDVLPGDYIAYVWTVAGLCDPRVPITMFMTSTDWGHLATEVKSKQRVGVDGNPTPDTFSELIVGSLTVVNAKTENQDLVDEANQQAARDAHFTARKEALISGRGKHDPRIM